MQGGPKTAGSNVDVAASASVVSDVTAAPTPAAAASADQRKLSVSLPIIKRPPHRFRAASPEGFTPAFDRRAHMRDLALPPQVTKALQQLAPIELSHPFLEGSVHVIELCSNKKAISSYLPL